MSKTQILSQKQILNSYRKKIASSFKRQQIAGQATINAILEIGNLLIEVREYKDSLVLPYKENAWKEFIVDLGFSMSSVTRYIRIAEHPVICDKKYHRHLPSSVYSLYEISSIEPKQMLRLINAGGIHTEMGRSEITSIKHTRKSKKIQSDKIDLLHVKVPKDILEGNYYSILNEITEFLRTKGLDFEYGKEIEKIDKAEAKAFQKIEKFVFNKAKKYFDKSIKLIIERKGRESNLWKNGSKLSLKIKAKKVGYNFDEISTSDVTNISDLTDKYNYIGWEDLATWNNLILDWMSDGMSKYGDKIHQHQNDNHADKQILSADNNLFHEFSRKKKNNNFTRVKFKDIKV